MKPTEKEIEAAMDAYDANANLSHEEATKAALTAAYAVKERGKMIKPTEKEIEAAAEALCNALGGDWKYALKNDHTNITDWHRSNAKQALTAAYAVREGE